MTIMGSGQGGLVGRPLQPTEQELEMTATTQTARQMMGLVHDTLEVPFTQVGGNLWKYKSDSGRPTLPPLNVLRTAKDDVSGEDESWRNIFKQILDKLPPEIKAGLEANAGKPMNLKNSNFSSLENTLAFAARALQWLNKASGTPQAEGAFTQRTYENLQVPAKAMRGMLSQTNTVLKEGARFLQNVGPNLPDHDKILQYLQQGQEMGDKLSDYVSAFGDPAYEKPTQEQLNDLAVKINQLLTQFNRVPPGKEMLMLGPVFESMAMMAEALALTPASPSLFIGLKAALKGAGSSQSMLAVFGGDFEAMLNAIMNGLIETIMPGADQSKKKMMAMLILTTMGGANILAALMGEYGLGRLPVRNEADYQAAKSYGLKLALQLLASSGAIEEILASISQACGLTEKQIAEMASSLSAAALLTIILTAVKGQPENALAALQDLKSHISGKLEIIEPFVTQAFTEAIAAGQIPPGISVYLQQAKAALNQDDLQGFLAACRNALELINSSPEQIKEDLDELKDFGIQVMRAASGAVDEDTNTITGMITAA